MHGDRRAEFTSQASAATQGDVDHGAQALHEVGVLLDEEHVVTLDVQVGGDGGPHAAGPGDGDLHEPVLRPRPSSPVPSSRRSKSTTASFNTLRQVQHVGLLADEIGDVETRHATPGDGDEVDPAGYADIS